VLRLPELSRTRVGGIPELVEEGTTGVLVPSGDAHALAAALDGLIGNPSRRRTMGVWDRSGLTSGFPPTQSFPSTRRCTWRVCSFV